MPVTLLYGRERARVASLALSLLRTVRSAYTPELALEQASEFLFLHSDRGSQYAAEDYQAELAKRGLKGSMGHLLQNYNENRRSSFTFALRATLQNASR